QERRARDLLARGKCLAGPGNRAEGSGPPLSLRLRHWLRPPRTLKSTRAGRVCVLMTLGVGVGALNTGNNLLYLVLGLLLSAIVASGILSELSLKGIEVRRLGTDGAFADEPFVFRWAISSQKRWSFALSLSEEGAPLEGEGWIAHLSP